MDDVVSQTNEMESAVKDSTEEMNDQAEAMSDLSEKFQGAMGAIVTGLAVAAAGLLAQIPILGELFGALGAVLDAVAFQLDRVFRPVLAPVTDLILDLADAIFAARGPLTTLATIAVGVATALGAIVGPILVIAAKIFGAAKVMGALAAAGKVVIGVLTAIASAISLPVVAIAALVAGLALLAYHFREEISNAIQTAIAAFKDFVPKAMLAIRSVVKRVTSAFTSLVSKAKEWGRSLIEKLVQGIRDASGIVRDIVEGINLTAGVTIGDVAGTVGEVGGAAADAGSNFIGSVGQSASDIFLDGDKLNDNMGRRRKSALARRGG
jgi:phage-related protein